MVIFGAIGSGKTSLAWYFTRREKRLIIVDTAEEERYLSAGVHVHNVDDVAEIVERSPVFRIVFRSEVEDDIRWLFRLSRAAKNLVILVEEASQYKMGSSAVSEDFQKTVRFGRHDGVRIVATTQRPSDVHKLLISQSDIVLGKIFETNDARYLKGMGGVTKDTIESASRLPDPVVRSGKLSIHYISALDNKTRRVDISV